METPVFPKESVQTVGALRLLCTLTTEAVSRVSCQTPLGRTKLFPREGVKGPRKEGTDGNAKLPSEKAERRWALYRSAQL